MQLGKHNGWAQAAGFNAMLVPPAALVVGTTSELYWLNFVLLLVVAPLAHGAFGYAGEQRSEWSESSSQWLHRLPSVAAVALLVACVVVAIGTDWLTLTAVDVLSIGASLWSAFAMGSCIAHDLLHRQSRLSRALGRVLAGVIGYPLLEHEHRAHHEISDWPRRDETVWSYSWRRALSVVRGAIERDRDARAWSGSRWSGGLFPAVASSITVAALFLLSGGAMALLCYAVVVVAVAWTVQAMTYVQHWGLHADDLHGKPAAREWSWEDDCMLQAWLTVGLSLHQAHHDREGGSYYRLGPTPDAPHLPGGYVPLLFMCMVPALWFRVMTPHLDRWMASPVHEPSMTGRRLVCVPH